MGDGMGLMKVDWTQSLGIHIAEASAEDVIRGDLQYMYQEFGLCFCNSYQFTNLS